MAFVLLPKERSEQLGLRIRAHPRFARSPEIAIKFSYHVMLLTRRSVDLSDHELLFFKTILLQKHLIELITTAATRIREALLCESLSQEGFEISAIMLRNLCGQ